MSAVIGTKLPNCRATVNASALLGIPPGATLICPMPNTACEGTVAVTEVAVQLVGGNVMVPILTLFDAQVGSKLLPVIVMLPPLCCTAGVTAVIHGVGATISSRKVVEMD